MNSYNPAGLEAATTDSLYTGLAIAPSVISQPMLGNAYSPTSAVSAVLFLSFFALGPLAFIIYWTRRRRTISKVSNKPPLEKAAVCDVEALTAIRSIVPITPLPDVRWTPQIRSIRGPGLDKGSDNKTAALPSKRARSPPPSIKPRNLLSDPYAASASVSAPVHMPSFMQNENFRPSKSSKGDRSPPVTPQALAVSGMQSRSLGRSGAGTEC